MFMSAMVPITSDTVTSPTSFPSSTTGNLRIMCSRSSRAAVCRSDSGVMVIGSLVMRRASCSSSGLRRMLLLVTSPTTFESLSTGTPEICLFFRILRTSSLEPGRVAHATSLTMISSMKMFFGISSTPLLSYDPGFFLDTLFCLKATLY